MPTRSQNEEIGLHEKGDMHGLEAPNAHGGDQDLAGSPEPELRKDAKLLPQD